MSDEGQEQINPIDAIREEFASEIKALKESFEASNKEKDELIAQLKESNQQLQRSIVRNTLSKSDEVAHVPTEAEKYEEQVKALSKRTLEYMKLRG